MPQICLYYTCKFGVITIKYVIMYRLHHCLDVDIVIPYQSFSDIMETTRCHQQWSHELPQSPIYLYIKKGNNEDLFSSLRSLISINTEQICFRRMNWICPTSWSITTFVYAKYLFSEQMFQGWLVNEWHFNLI